MLNKRALTEEEATLKAEIFMEYEELIKNEECAWRQSSRILWLKEGDNNTKFFHNSANSHKRSNHIDQLEVEGKIITERDRVREEIIKFYEKLYFETEKWRPDGNLLNCPSI